ncbi:hypothetical protein CRG98_047312 [Punica granatum]|uniref:Uncharacterized protein n=1 Tax=Punica granatum TaxID=22663 RepID=A0A2I0HLX4_PUNGR|nr:hypothetical protein CRG98_047312 [Punica granatum]
MKEQSTIIAITSTRPLPLAAVGSYGHQLIAYAQPDVERDADIIPHHSLIDYLFINWIGCMNNNPTVTRYDRVTKPRSAAVPQW